MKRYSFRPSVHPSVCLSMGCCRFAHVGLAGRIYELVGMQHPNVGSAMLSVYIGS